MKKLLFTAAVLLGGLSLKAQEIKPEDAIKVNTERHDFGKIKQNVPVTTHFEITNITDKPLVIENAWGSCGCTTPEVPKEPIAPNATAKLKVQYNAAALNHFDKDVYIKLAGIQQPKVVKITGDVLDAAAFDAYTKGAKAEGSKSLETTKAKPAPVKKAKPIAKAVKS